MVIQIMPDTNGKWRGSNRSKYMSIRQQILNLKAGEKVVVSGIEGDEVDRTRNSIFAWAHNQAFKDTPRKLESHAIRMPDGTATLEFRVISG